MFAVNNTEWGAREWRKHANTSQTLKISRTLYFSGSRSWALRCEGGGGSIPRCHDRVDMISQGYLVSLSLEHQ